MGILDRDYYRREGPSFLGSLADRGKACKWLILANVVAYVFQLVTADGGDTRSYGWFTDAFILDVQAVWHGQVWRLLTYSFLHDPNPSNIWHIVFNMLFLWWFGKDVEDLYGTREFLCYYLLSALLGGCAFVLWSFGRPGLCLGASGAVTAVMVLYALHYPHRRIYIWFVLPIPIWAFVAFQVAQDTFIFIGGIKTTTAVTVHLAGAVFGFCYKKLGWRLSALLPDFKAWRRQRSRPRLRVYREEQEPVPVAAPPAGDVDEHLEAKLDAVLEKVARHGKESLTESERQVLVRASEIYRKRRT